MTLTDTAIRTAKPTTKPQRLFDGSGLYLQVSPAGGKLWRLKYRHGGKEKRLAPGTYPDTRLKDAREKRDAARKLQAAGVDPGEQRKAAKAAGEERAANSLKSSLASGSPNMSRNGPRVIREGQCPIGE